MPECNLKKNGLTSFVYTDDYSVPDLLYRLINVVKNLEDDVTNIKPQLTTIIQNMVDSGELSTLISEQILTHKLNSWISYAAMKESPLEDNTFNVVMCRDSLDDGGSGIVLATTQSMDDLYLMETVDGTNIYYIPVNSIYNIRLISPTSEQLENLINKNPVGSKFYFPRGTYVFNNISVNVRLQECTFYGDGTGTYAGVGSSNITSNTTNGWFLTLNAGAYNLHIRDLYFYGDKTANGINFAEAQPDDGTYSRTDDIYFTRCIFGSYYRTGVQINTSCGYVFFKNCSFLGRSSSTEAYGVRVGESYSNTVGALPNYLYFIETDFQGYVENNGGIAIYCGSQFFIQNCDFAALTAPAVALLTSSSSRTSIGDVFISNNMFYNNKSSSIQINTNQLLLNINISENTFVLATIALDIAGSSITIFNLINNTFRNFSAAITDLLTISNVIWNTNLTGNCNNTGVYLTNTELYYLRADARIFPQPRCEHNVPNGDTTFVLGGTSLASANTGTYYNMLNAVNPGDNISSVKTYNASTNEYRITLTNSSQNQYRIEYVLETNWRT